MHGCLLDGSCLLRRGRAATFLRVGGCLVRTSCIVVGLALPGFRGSLDHSIVYARWSGLSLEAPSQFDRSLDSYGWLSG